MKMRKKHTSARDGHGGTKDRGNLRDDGRGRVVVKVRTRQERNVAWTWMFAVGSKWLMTYKILL